MRCVSASNSVKVLRTNSSSSFAREEHRRNVHLINNVARTNRTTSECSCSVLPKKIEFLTSRRILRFKQRALLVLFVWLMFYEVESSPSRRRYGRYCSKELADALEITCGKPTQATQTPLVRETGAPRRPKRVRVDIIDMCCRNPCHMTQLERFCGGKRLLTPQERNNHHMRMILTQLKINTLRVNPNRSRLIFESKIRGMGLSDFWSTIAAVYKGTSKSIVSSMARIRQGVNMSLPSGE